LIQAISSGKFLAGTAAGLAVITAGVVPSQAMWVKERTGS
jgi:hypothetical protein